MSGGGYDSALKKARAVEAVGGAKVSINQYGGQQVKLEGDLHTAPDRDSENPDNPEFVIPDFDRYIGLNINVLGWEIRDQGVILGYDLSALKFNANDNWQSNLPTNGEKITAYLTENGSYLTGAANGNIDLKVSNDTAWYMTADSRFTGLRPEGGSIYLYDPDGQNERMNLNNDYAFQKLTVGHVHSPTGDSGSAFVINTDILNVKNTGAVLSFDGMTYHGGELISDGKIDDQGIFIENPVYLYKGQEVPVSLLGLSTSLVKNELSYEKRHGDFINILTAEPGDHSYKVLIHDNSVKNDAAYDDAVLKFATVPKNVKLLGEAVRQNGKEYEYTPIIWNTEHYDSGQSVFDETSGTFTIVDDTLYSKAAYNKLGLTEGASDENDMQDYWLSGYKKSLSQEAEQAKDFGSSYGAYLTFRADLTDLRHRLGEVRYGAQEGWWAKGIYDKERASGVAGGGLKQETYGMHVGGDSFIVNNEDESCLVGASMRLSHSKQRGLSNSSLGSGSLDAYTAKLYAVYMGKSGAYADLVFNLGYFDQEMSLKANDDNSTSHGSYNTYGAGASLEVGRMFSFDERVDDRQWYNHYFIEPQLQLAYYWLKGRNWETSTGMRVSQSNVQSLLGRAGVVIGKKFNYGGIDDLDKRYFQAAFRAGIINEFMGKQDITLNQSYDFRAEMGGTTFYYGVEGDWQFARSQRLYLNVDRESGHNYQKEISVRLGYRYEF